MDINNEYGVLQVQKELLELLKEFDHFCIANHIEYSVIGGSLLGTIRHKGFIPWDDDLDIIVDRNNYTKLKAGLPQGRLEIDTGTTSSLWVDRIKLKSNKSSTGYPPIIDLFILDNYPVNPIVAGLKYSIIAILQGMIKIKPNFSAYSIGTKVISFILWGLGAPFSIKFKLRLYHLVSTWGNKDCSQYKCIYNDQYYLLRQKYPASIMNTLLRLPFEDIEVYSIKNYDEYLTQIFGDYMRLPDEEDRRPIHQDIKN